MHTKNEAPEMTNPFWRQLTYSLMVPFKLIWRALCRLVHAAFGWGVMILLLASLGLYITQGIDWLSKHLWNHSPRPQIMAEPDPVAELVEKRTHVISKRQVSEELSSLSGLDLVIEVTTLAAPQNSTRRVLREAKEISVTLDPNLSQQALSRSEQVSQRRDISSRHLGPDSHDELPQPAEPRTDKSDYSIGQQDHEQVTPEERRAIAQQKLNQLLSEHVKQTIHANRHRYQKRLDDLVSRLKQEADEDIWLPALDQTAQFVREFYHLRSYEAEMKEKMRIYLFPEQELINSYYEFIVIELNRSLHDLINELIQDAIPGAQLSLKSANLHLGHDELESKLQDLLPTPDEMVQSVYRNLEGKGLHQSIAGVERWRQFELEHPGVSFTTKTLVLLATLAVVSSPVIVVGALGSYALAVGSSVHFHQERDAYQAHLRGSLLTLQADYHGQVRHFAESIFDGTLLYLSGEVDAQPSLVAQQFR